LRVSIFEVNAMRHTFQVARNWYRSVVWGNTYLGDILLLVVRLYWGSMLARSGWQKLVNLDATAQFFDSLHIVWPKVNAIVSGCVEFSCGVLLVIGLAARIAAIPLVVNLLVAFSMASRDRLLAVFSSPNDFVTAPEFLYLFACLLVLVFGPGAVSVDALACVLLGRLPAEGPAAREALRTKYSSELSGAFSRGRREFAKLAAAAAAGLCAGLLIRSGGGPPAKDRAAGQLSGAGNESTKTTTTNESVPPPPAGTDLALLMAGDPHVCRGLNTCKGKGKDHKNSCAGQGACATAESHACNGLNDCKGQGGCDGTAGINQCKGKGACAVPLKDETWKLARARFEQLAARRHLKIGTAPAAEKTES
jgi:putative oxidoreductase